MQHNQDLPGDTQLGNGPIHALILPDRSDQGECAMTRPPADVRECPDAVNVPCFNETQSRSAAAAASALPALRIEVFTSIEEAETLWRAAQTTCACTAFQSFEWLSTWQQTIGTVERVQACIVHIADGDGATLMLLPFGIRRRHGIAVLSFLGGVATDYHAPLIRSEFAARLDGGAVAELLSRVLLRLPPVDLVAFEKMPSEIAATPNPFAALPGAVSHWSAHAARLGASFEEFRKRRSAKFLADSHRRWRRLSEIGEPQFDCADAPEAATAILRVLAQQKSCRWRETGARDLFADRHYLAFYERMTERYLGSGLVHVSSLRVGESVVATQWGMIFGGRFYYLLQGNEFGPWARFAVGRMLAMRLIEFSIKRGLATFDLTVGDETYKRDWADHSTALYDYTQGVSMRGRLAVALRDAVERSKKRAKRNDRLVALARWVRNRRLELS